MRIVEITSPALPGAVFDSVEALRTFVHERQAYEDACQAFERDQDSHDFAMALSALGYEVDEIAKHIAATVGYRSPELFIA